MNILFKQLEQSGWTAVRIKSRNLTVNTFFVEVGFDNVKDITLGDLVLPVDAPDEILAEFGEMESGEGEHGWWGANK